LNCRNSLTTVRFPAFGSSTLVCRKGLPLGLLPGTTASG